MFHQIAEKTVHVSDRCSKVALVRFADAFSIGPDLTNSNADAFHSGMGEIVAMPVEEISDSLHVGYLLQKNVAVSAAMAVFLDYLGRVIVFEDSLFNIGIRFMKYPGTGSTEDCIKNAPSGLSRMAHVSFVSVKLS